MPNLPKAKTQKWWSVKAQIMARFGSVAAAARKLECSPEAIRLSVAGKCPRVAAKLKELLK